MRPGLLMPPLGAGVVKDGLATAGQADQMLQISKFDMAEILHSTCMEYVVIILLIFDQSVKFILDQDN